MKQEVDSHVFTGMQRDTDFAKIKPEYLTEAYNIRISTNKPGEGLAITSERGSTLMTIYDEEGFDKQNLSGNKISVDDLVYVSHCILGEYIVLFCNMRLEEGNTNCICRLKIYNESVATMAILFRGLISEEWIDNPGINIDSVGLYENDLIQKVYWVDGVNQVRFINIVADKLHGITVEEQENRYKNDDGYYNGAFDCSPELALKEKIFITTESNASGMFPACALQYAITYNNKYGQETNIAWVSPLFYTTFIDRAGSPEETIKQAFKIHMANVDTNYDYLNIYSIKRTSLDGQPVVKRIASLLTKDLIVSQDWDIGVINVAYPFNDYTFNQEFDFENLLINPDGEIGNWNPGRPVENTINQTTLANASYISIGQNSINTSDSSGHLGLHGLLEAGLQGTKLEDLGELKSYHLILLAKKDFEKFSVRTSILKNSKFEDELKTTNDGHITRTIGDESLFERFDVNNNTNTTGPKGSSAGSRLDISPINRNGRLIIKDADFDEWLFTWHKDAPDNAVLAIFVNRDPYMDNVKMLLKVTEVATFTYDDIEGRLTRGNRFADLFAANKVQYKSTFDRLPTFVDTNTTGEDVDPTYLLYVGSEEISATTLAEKDNTLFLGNISIKRPVLPKSVVEAAITKDDIKVDIRNIKNPYSNTNLLHGVTPGGNQFLESSLTFKTGEYYRLGVQFQYKNGKWSEPIYLTDSVMTIPPDAIPDTLSTFSALLNNCKPLLDLGYKKARGVVVLPKESDRKVLAQGIFNPTVYNVASRANGIVSSQASWYYRPKSTKGKKNLNFQNIQWKHDYTLYGFADLAAEIQGVPNEFGNISINELDSLFEYRTLVDGTTSQRSTAKVTQWHNSADGHSETNTEKSLTKYVLKSDLGNVFAVDQKRVTFHSPDVIHGDYWENLDLSLYSAKAVGDVTIERSYCDTNIEMASPTIDGDGLGVTNIKSSTTGAGTLAAGFMYQDAIVNDKAVQDSNEEDGWRYTECGVYKKKITTDEDIGSIFKKGNEVKPRVNYLVYPWHRSGSLNNDFNRGSAGGTRSGNLSKKKISNYKKATTTWNLDYSYNVESTPLKSFYIGLFNYDVVSVLKYKAGLYGNNLIYEGNIDTLLLPPLSYASIWYCPWYFMRYTYGDKVALNSSQIVRDLIVDNNTIETNPYVLWAFNNTFDVDNNMYLFLYTWDLNRNLRQIRGGSTYRTDVDDAYTVIVKSSYTFESMLRNDIGDHYSQLAKTKESIRMKYKTTPHLLVSLTESLQDKCKESSLVLGEIYRDDYTPDFGGTTSIALQAHDWIAAGPAVDLKDGNKVEWMYGDCYYSTYECMKTYPFTNEDPNQLVDAISFKVESRINPDGRYDRNRGSISLLNCSPTNYNLMNSVYNQHNNFFTYKILDDDYYKISDYHTTITWTLTHTAFELIDSWTHLTLANTIMVDGALGKLTKLMSTDDHIYYFQPNGIGTVNFNSRVQINTTDGVPIEISNNGKVDGVTYASKTLGTSVFKRICKSVIGIYFIDDNSSDLYYIGGKDGISSISANAMMSSVFIGNCNSPLSLYYDFTNNDLYIKCNSEFLCYSEKLKNFLSFYNYDTDIAMLSKNGYLIGLHSNFEDGIYSLCTSEDHNLAGNTGYEYSIEFVSNQNAASNKTFSTIDIRGLWKDNVCFDKIYTEDYYQEGNDNLKINNYINTNAERKFGVWRLQIPRDTILQNKDDRMSNTWLRIGLIGTKPMILHDLNVNYFI